MVMVHNTAGSKGPPVGAGSTRLQSMEALPLGDWTPVRGQGLDTGV